MLEFEDDNGNGESNWVLIRFAVALRKECVNRNIVTVGSAEWIEIDPATLKPVLAKHAVSEEQFKGMILDIVMREKENISVGIRNMLLDVMSNYIVSPVWKDMRSESLEKPENLEIDKYYFMPVNEEFCAINPYWGEAGICKKN